MKNQTEQQGKITITGKGIGFITPFDDQKDSDDLFVSTENLNTALNRDTVSFVITRKNSGDKKAEARVTKVIERAKESFTGTLEKYKNSYRLIADDFHLYVPIIISDKKLGGAKVSDKIAVKITKWENPDNDPEGEVVEVFGKGGEHEAEMRAILFSSGFESNFSKSVLDEAEKILAEIPSEEIAKRRDMRGTETFTIDPVDAKDFDDALSFKKLENGNYEIGIHIADVSYYVEEDGPLDCEAVERATSVYLVDRTIPMLPERLSNDLCSLKPNVDRLAYSIILEVNKEADVISEWIGRTVIHSNKRFTYEEAQKILDGADSPHKDALLEMNLLAKKLHKKNVSAGAISFENDEVRFCLDEKGKPLSVGRKIRTDSNKLIEDFMLLANRKVAERLSKLSKDGPAVYRNHDLPNIDRIANLSSFIQKFGYSLNIKNNIIPSRELNDLVDRVNNTPEQNVIQTGVLRSMAKAAYSTENIGHYGLAFEHYTHFTSPIRRYPDIMVHRLLTAYSEGKGLRKKKHYEKMCLHSSVREIEAAEAERASVKYKQVEYMSERIGQIFPAKITGVTKWGMYAETIDEKCEGMIRLADMDDYFNYDESNYSLIGEKTGKVYRLGDEIKIKVERADMEKRQLDFSIAE